MQSNIRANRLFAAMFLFGLLIVLLTTLITTLFSNKLIKTFAGDDPGWPAVIVLGLILTVALFFLARAAAHQAVRVIGAEAKVRRSDGQEQLPYLMMGYSPQRAEMTIDRLLGEMEALGPAVVAASVKDYRQACQKRGVNELINPWQQNLRSAWHHRANLRAIYVLLPDKDQFAHFKTYMIAALKADVPNLEIFAISDPDSKDGKPFVATYPDGTAISPDYDDYSYVYEGMLRGIDMIAQRHDAAQFTAPKSGLKGIFALDAASALDRQICIDATAGVKIFSIAAATLTLNRSLKFSYVTTGQAGTDIGGEVRFYDTNLKIAGS